MVSPTNSRRTQRQCQLCQLPSFSPPRKFDKFESDHPSIQTFKLLRVANSQRLTQLTLHYSGSLGCNVN